MEYILELPPFLQECPNEWKNFIKYLETSGSIYIQNYNFSILNNILNEYNAEYIPKEIGEFFTGAKVIFETPEDAIVFKLKYR